MYWIQCSILFVVRSATLCYGQVEQTKSAANGEALGPPRQLSLGIGCETTRPCIIATWLPPAVNSTNYSEPGSGNAAWHHLVAYRVRYLLVAAIDPKDEASHKWPEEDSPFLRTVEKNVTRLQFSTTAGEHRK